MRSQAGDRHNSSRFDSEPTVAELSHVVGVLGGVGHSRDQPSRLGERSHSSDCGPPADLPSPTTHVTCDYATVE